MSANSAGRTGAPLHLVRALALCLLLQGAMSAAHAQSAEALAAFDSGVKAYRAERFESALNSFLAARRLGMEGPNLDLNLGLAYYRLGRYADAQASFLKIRNDLRYTAIADYHLGLVAAQLGEREPAMERLEAARYMTPNPALRNLSSSALSRLDDTILEEDLAAATARSRERAGYYLRAGTGVDSNPELLNDTLEAPAQDESAAYAELLGNFDLPFETGRPSGITALRGGVYLRQHKSEQGLDQYDADLGLRHRWTFGDWRLGLQGEGGAAWLDGQPYQRTGGFAVDLRHDWNESSATLRYGALRIDAREPYGYLEGWRHRTEAQLNRSMGSLRLRSEYEFEYNDRADLIADEEFTSYSPQRHALSLALGTSTLRKFSLEWRARYRLSRYRDPNLFEEDGELREERRDDRLASTGLRARLRAGETWNWLLDYQYSRNESSVDSYEYVRQLLLFGIEWLR
jgi:hypothetical protein